MATIAGGTVPLRGGGFVVVGFAHAIYGNLRTIRRGGQRRHLQALLDLRQAAEDPKHEVTDPDSLAVLGEYQWIEDASPDHQIVMMPGTREVVLATITFEGRAVRVACPIVGHRRCD
jgi:hypothetical protein